MTAMVPEDRAEGWICPVRLIALRVGSPSPNE